MIFCLSYGATPVGVKYDATPVRLTPVDFSTMTPEKLSTYKHAHKYNCPISDQELNEILLRGYKFMPPLDGYTTIQKAPETLMAAPTPGLDMELGFMILGTLVVSYVMGNGLKELHEVDIDRDHKAD